MTDSNIERWLAEKAQVRTAREAEVIEALGPAMAEAEAEIEELLVTALPEGSPSREVDWAAAQPQLEAILAKLNDKDTGTLAAGAGGGAEAAPGACSAVAGPARWISPCQLAAELLQAIVVGEVTLAEWFRRRYRVGARTG